MGKRFTKVLFLILISSLMNNLFYKVGSINEVKTASKEFDDTIKWVQSIGDKNGEYPNGFDVSTNIATRGIAVYKNELYVGTQNLNFSKIRFTNPLLFKIMSAGGILAYGLFEHVRNNNVALGFFNLLIPIAGIASDGCEVWKYNYSMDKWLPLVSDQPDAMLPAGFGDQRNFAAAVMQEFKGDLYVGTAAGLMLGCQLWRYNGTTWERVAERGFGDHHNIGVWSITTFDDELYVGTLNCREGCQIWKTNDGETWEKMPLPGGDGFGMKWNIYAWSMGVYNNSLYVGTLNFKPDQGCQLWRYNGEQWLKISLPGGDGFGEKENYGIRNMVEYNGDMYVATATSIFSRKQGCEIWRYDGNTWHPVIGEKGVLDDGFGNIYNKYAWSMVATSNGKLWVGTSNIQPFGRGNVFGSTGCEVWCYDGKRWMEMVGDESNSGAGGGFGNRCNIGARSMIEYPENSGRVVVGTFTLDVIDFHCFKGCEVWMNVPFGCRY